MIIKRHNTRGSVMISVVIIGMILVSAFFFFASRQLSRATAQAKAMEYQNSKTYLDSYIDYIINEKEEINTPLTFDNITIEYFTHNTDEITGSADFGQEDTYNATGPIIIEWNKCSANYKADIIIDTGSDDIFMPHDSDSECNANSPGYDDKTGESSNLIEVSGPFTLKTVNAPFQYRIRPMGGTQLRDDGKWHLKAYMDLGYKKRITVEKTF